MKTIVEQFREQAQARPDQIAFESPLRCWRFDEVDATASRIANGLSARGLGRGDRIAALTRHTAECTALVLAANKIGAVCMPVNWRLAPPELEYILRDGRARVLFCDPEFMPAVAKADVPSLELTLATIPGNTEALSLAEWCASFSDADTGLVPGPDDAALQLYSSGTTGLPKGVELSFGNLAAGVLGATASAIHYHGPPDQVFLNVLPTFHIAGIGVALLTGSLGGKSILYPEFEPAQVLAAIGKHRVTHAFLVPAMIQFLLAAPQIEGADLSSMQAISYGASPITERVLVDALRVFDCRFIQVYGLTETTGAVTALAAEDHATEGPKQVLLRSAGRAMDGVTIKIVDTATGQMLPDGEVGEVWIRTRQNMLGYWAQPSASADVLVPDGDGAPPWFRSGDAGYLRDGYLFLHDRIKDMIVSGGENIYPAEVENALMQHPGIADGAVIGVPDERWGESVKAIVVPGPGATLAEHDIIEFLRERIAHFKCPRSVDFVDAIPRNPSGKILKRVLREPYWKDRERRIS
ncbi:MAG: long-chain-fatty-acid--CoA ligase [Burkholderiaceae bacterium]|nr:long-chain-fatty-acid--CoA ligase [Burkholderiaceae bacterium]